MYNFHIQQRSFCSKLSKNLVRDIKWAYMKSTHPTWRWTKLICFISIQQLTLSFRGDKDYFIYITQYILSFQSCCATENLLVSSDEKSVCCLYFYGVLPFLPLLKHYTSQAIERLTRMKELHSGISS